jgi:hypothetical protein
MTGEPEPRPPDARATPTKVKAGLKKAACVLFVWHMLATCAQQIPRQSALSPASKPFVHYQELTGLWQGWDMFTTIPYYHAYNLDVVATEEDGRVERIGVGLPGFSKFGHVIRTETMFSRILYEPDFRPYLDAYADKMCAAIHARLGHGGQKIVVRESCERMRYAEQIRADGVIALHEEHSSPTFTCGE